MTDNEIINEWKDEIHRAEYIDSSYCDCIDLILIKNTLDLINRQRAEIEKMRGSTIVSNIMEIQKIKREAKAEAYKEFAEKLNEKAQIADCFDSYNMVVGTYFIDNLLEEMIGLKNEM